MKRLFICLMVVLICGLALRAMTVNPFARSDTKFTTDEIVSKHLASIGTPEARAAFNSIVIQGTTHATFRSRGIAEIDGGAVLASTGRMNMVTMKFGAADYPYEKIGFDGKNVTANQLRPGEYSNLGAFTRTFSVMMDEGLVGGTLSTAWPLEDLANRKPKLEFAGAKKLNSRELLEVKYLPHHASEMNISLYFDPETFQHVRTVYQRLISAQMGRTPESSSGQRETRYELIEEYSDFKTEHGLALPHTYKLRLSQVGSGAQYTDFTMSLQNFFFNQKLEAKDFDVSGK